MNLCIPTQYKIVFIQIIIILLFMPQRTLKIKIVRNVLYF